jgi:hypothetical protein
LRKVMENLRSVEGATVQFGEMGQGIQPNYQVCFPNGNVNPYRGANHQPFMPVAPLIGNTSPSLFRQWTFSVHSMPRLPHDRGRAGVKPSRNGGNRIIETLYVVELEARRRCAAGAVALLALKRCVQACESRWGTLL